jgi:predicted MPP superfamily phosphohydrolase
MLSGHTHGGQVALPWIGPIFTNSPLPNRIGAGGLHERAGTRLYVSRGVGMEAGFAPPIRFLCRPEISLLILRGP